MDIVGAVEIFKLSILKNGLIYDDSSYKDAVEARPYAEYCIVPLNMNVWVTFKNALGHKGTSIPHRRKNKVTSKHL